VTSRKCNLIILGPPGAGKGTQARVVAKSLGVPHVDCGRVLRDEAAAETEFGVKATEFVVKGKLVPDELIISIMLKRIRQPDCDVGFLLDGFPRTLGQAKGLDRQLEACGERLDNIISLSISEETTIERLSSRRYCPADGRVYNIFTAPPATDGECDDCGGDLIQRTDDEPDTIRERFRVYHRETEPLIEYYSSNEGFLDINGGLDADVVAVNIISAIRAGGRCGI
jgi:adenylate kinase